jgi:hypothetical protein
LPWDLPPCFGNGYTPPICKQIINESLFFVEGQPPGVVSSRKEKNSFSAENNTFGRIMRICIKNA